MNIVELNTTDIVEFLKKPRASFTKADLKRFVKAQKIRHVNFMYAGGDGRLKTLNFILNDEAYLDEILTCGERVDGSSLFSYIEASSSDLYVVPRYSTAFVDPFAELPTLCLLCSFFNKDGEPLESSPEYTLKKACDAFKKATGYEFEAMGELEYYVIAPQDWFAQCDECGGAALFPEAPLQNIISGSGIVDVDDTAGFGKGAHIVLVQHGPGLCVWTAPDGEHYEYWKGNPIARGIRGADPKVVWYAKDRRWICLTHGREHDVYTVFINSSPNLREWREESKFYGDHVSKGRGQYMHECPGLEELRIRGEEGTGWILWGANAVSAIGSFDGHVFSPERERVPTYQKDADEKGWPWYAAQAFQNAPDGRTVLVPWLRTTIIGFEKRSAFNQAMGIPQELELVRTPEGLRLSRLPVKEMDSLRAGPAVPFERFRGELAEVHVTCEPGPDAELAFDFRGVPMTWSSRTHSGIRDTSDSSPIRRAAATISSRVTRTRPLTMCGSSEKP